MTATTEFDHTDPVFISYRHSDGTDTTAELAWLLRAAGIPVWRDVDDLPPGDTNQRLKQAIDSGLSGAVLVITPDVELSPVIQEVEAPRLINLHENHSDFALGIVNAVRKESGAVDYGAPDRVLNRTTETLTGVDQKASTRDGLVALVRGMVFHRIAHRRSAVESNDGTFNLTVQTRNTPQVYDRTGSELDIRIRPSEHERLPSAEGLVDLADVIQFLPTAVTRAGAKGVRVTGGAHLSVALAIGMALPASRIGRLEVIDQRGMAWACDGIARMPDKPSLTVVASGPGSNGSKTIGRPRVAVYLDLMSPRSDTAFQKFVDENRSSLAVWAHLRHISDNPLDPASAGELAAEAAYRIRQFSTANANAEIDLLVRGPFAMAILVGSLLNTVRVTAYEWDDTQGPSYLPALRLLSSTTGGAVREVLL
ncbi:SAVED domain-containing protein [Cellulosimicrobium cellulans]|uniref:SAVED domain-containing protein n=1 Tax=Cellulosimicrobium cellulans TaxID=1710 RepID=A0A4Y4DX96_CELCE|nr:SAVED domain-containing protein [Cellulosimicrobium cellulans]GED08008.1 hypothetical protein CCE02nite_00070 [Cellulosimicrobium cellulans]